MTKSYVDTAIAAALSGSPQDTSPYVLKAGDTMTGALNLAADPVSANQAADKHYVDVMVGSAGGGGSTGAVKLLPPGTQTVTQPAATDLEVNRLNGVEASNLYATPGVNNGIAQAAAASDCAGASAAGLGCTVLVPSTINGSEHVAPATWGNQTHVIDQRFGAQHDTYFNPHNADSPEAQTGQQIDVQSTESTQHIYQTTGGQIVSSIGLQINQEGLAGGSNLFPENLESTPYFKTTYSALALHGIYNTPGQHVLNPMETDCFAVGDCLIGSQFLYSMGGFRDSADEGTHPYDIQVSEDPRVFQGVCSTGCTPGSQTVTVGSQTSGGTQGEGRYLIDKSSTKVITQGQLTGGTAGGIHASANFSGTNFPVSTFFATNVAELSQATNLAPGTVTVPIATSGVPAGYSTNTAAAPSGSGVACVTDRINGATPQNPEMAAYTVVDGTHLQMTLAKPHAALATIAIGGLCGYGVEQTVDTVNGIRQVFPVIGSTSPNSLYYSGLLTSILGVSSQTSAFMSLNQPIVSAVRNNNFVTLTLAGNLPVDTNGLTLTVAGAADTSFNGSFQMTTTSSTTLTYAESGPNSTTSGGTVSYLTGGYALYPMAEVTSVFNTTTKTVDGQITLAPNTVAWASNDPVEEPHYFQVAIAPDTTLIRQTSPRPNVFQSGGITYLGNNGPGLRGFQVANATPASNYFGNGGTHGYPDIAISSVGVWNRTFEVQAGEQSLIHAVCNSKGCNRWNSGYNLFELDSAVGSDTVAYRPDLSAVSMSMRGTGYSFTPQAFNAGTANIGTLNVTTLNVANGGGQAGMGLAAGGVLTVPAALNTGLLADYNFYQQSGTALTDMSGNGNHGALASGSQAPTWTGQGLAFQPGQGVSLPAALNVAKTFVIETYLNPIANTGPSDNYPALVTSSLGQNGVNLLTDYATGTNGYVGKYAYAPSIYGGSAQRTAVPNLVSGFHVLAYTLGSGNTDVDHIYIDGVEAGSYAVQVASGGLQTSGNLFFGSSNVGPWVGSGIFGTAYRMRVYSTELAAADVATVTQAMYSEAALRGIPTSPAPVNVTGPQFHAIGDSITYGYLANAAWPSVMSLTNQPNYTITNWGFTGITAISVAASEPNRVAPLCRTSAGPAVTVVMLGTNDLSTLRGATVQTTFRTLMGEVQTLKQAGCRVFVGTMISRVGADAQGGSVDADKDAYDALILTSAKGLGADGIIDFAANPLLGADGANTNSYFSADHTHPTTAGQQLLANAASNALNYYFGANEASPTTVTSLPYSMAAGDGYLSLTGLTSSGLVTLPDCTGQSGALYRISNQQNAYAVSVAPANGSQAINGLVSPITVPSNGSVTLRDVPNPKTVSGCHWEM